MRYILLKRRNNYYIRELEERKKYLFEIFNLWYIEEKNTNEYISLRSFPFNSLKEYIFLIGHCDAVIDYILNNDIKEKNLIIISCYSKRLENILKELKNKKVYYSLLNEENMTEMYEGSAYNIEFKEVSKSEILLYNYRYENLENKLEKSFKLWS